MTKIIHKITIDPARVSCKPHKSERGKISRRLNRVKEVTIEQFKYLIKPPYSCTWSGGIFNGSVSNLNWVSQSVFGLDFDDGTLSVQDIYSKLKEYGIIPNVWYHSFSSNESKIKLRVVLFLDTPVIDCKLHELIVNGLSILFPTADKRCNNRSSYFFGGLNSQITNQVEISVHQLIDVCSTLVIGGDNFKTRKLPVTPINNFLNSVSISPLLYNCYRNIDLKTNINSPLPTSLRGRVRKSIDWDVARQRVKILDMFMNYDWLYHNELFGLATNMNQIKGGIKLMRTIMEKTNEKKEKYTSDKFAILTYVVKMDYQPMMIKNFSRCKEDSELHDLISESTNVRGHIKILEPINKLTLKEAEKKFKSKFNEVINNEEVDRIYIFKVPTAIGKTERITNIHGTIATPTNSLKNEIGDRMKVEYVSTPDTVVFENNTLNSQIKYFYSMGLPQKSLEVINSVISPKNKDYYTSSDVELASEYIKKMKESYETSKTILTTHERSIYSNFSNDILIFDEDPIKSLLPIKQLEISDLFSVNLKIKNKELDGVIEFLSKSPSLEIRKTPLFNIDINEMVKSVSTNDSLSGSNIFDFFASDYFVKDTLNPNIIHYITKNDLPKDKKVVILSASVSPNFYKLLFGDRVVVSDISDVEQKGKINQFTKKSYSRNSLKQNHKEISKIVGNTPVITFKSYMNCFENPANMWFGNCSGYDTLKGEDISVVGTPHINNVVYFLTAKVLGIDFKTSDTTMTYQKITHNGFEFMFNCFDNHQLREIQFSYIESELVQSVGRSRTLREDSTVNLYSNYPLRISNKFYF